MPVTYSSMPEPAAISAGKSPMPPGKGQSTFARFYRPELDALRFLAFLMVFAYHTLPHYPVPQVEARLKGLAPAVCAAGDSGKFGLSLFFTLSAYLICEILLREREKKGTVSVQQFYIRRILRIWPLYFFVLAIGLGISYLPTFDHSRAPFVWFAVFLGNWHLLRLSAWWGNPVSPLWSVSIEEQFYLCAPWMVKYLKRPALFGLCGLLIVGANAAIYWASATPVLEARLWCDTFVQFQCFAAGILVCLCLRGRLPRLPGWLRCILMAAAYGCFLGASRGVRITYVGTAGPGSFHLAVGYALVTLGCVLLLLGFLGLDNKVLPGWLVYLGRISYGLYAYHLIAIDLVPQVLGRAPWGSLRHVLNGAIALGLNIVVAALSYRFFETPFLRLKNRHEIVPSRPV